jgi:uncharacterized protein YndB with AHSA1/START domain
MSVFHCYTTPQLIDPWVIPLQITAYYHTRSVRLEGAPAKVELVNTAQIGMVKSGEYQRRNVATIPLNQCNVVRYA